MTEKVESAWPHNSRLAFRMLTTSDLLPLKEYLKRNLYPDDPLSSIVGTSNEKEKDDEGYIASILPCNLSFAAFDSQNGKMTGVVLTSRKRRFGTNWSFPVESKELQIILQFVKQMQINDDDIKELDGLEEWAELRVLCVSQNFRRQGLATELIRRLLGFMKDFEFRAIKTVATSEYSKNICTKFGFKDYGKTYYKDMRDLEGRLMRPNAGDDQGATLMALRF